MALLGLPLKTLKSRENIMASRHRSVGGENSFFTHLLKGFVKGQPLKNPVPYSLQQ
jgi:hypothetical protein